MPGARKHANLGAAQDSQVHFGVGETEAEHLPFPIPRVGTQPHQQSPGSSLGNWAAAPRVEAESGPWEARQEARSVCFSSRSCRR